MTTMPPPPPGQGPVGPTPGGPVPGGYPPPGYPPPFYPPPPAYAAPAGGGFARAIFTTLATTILGISLALNVYLLLFSGALSSGRSGSLTREVIARGDPAAKIAVLPFEGILMDDSARLAEQLFEAVRKDPAVKAIVLRVDTPGGGVTASDQIHHRIRQFREEKNVPVVVAMGSLATSGGYYIACAADHIVAERTTLTGNIGVLLQRFNAADMLQKIGVEDATITSSGTPFKDAGSPFRADTPEETQYWQSLIDQAMATFSGVVAEGRSGRLKQPIEQIANGKAYTADEAMKLGLIDEVGYLDDAVRRAATLAGVSNPTVERLTKTPTLGEQLFGATLPGGGSGGVSVHLDASLLRELAEPKLMYLWTGH